MIKIFSEIVYTKGVRSGVLQLEYVNISMKMKFVSSHFSGTFRKRGTLRFDKDSFFNTLLGFDPNWDYKPPHTYTSDKNLNLSTTNKIHLKCDVRDGSIQNGVRQPILFCFTSDILSGYKVFCEPQTVRYKK